MDRSAVRCKPRLHKVRATGKVFAHLVRRENHRAGKKGPIKDAHPDRGRRAASGRGDAPSMDTALKNDLYRRGSAVMTPARLAIGITFLGGSLRLFHLNALSLWVDEGLTVTFARLSWPTLLGFMRVYSSHPPLYFALVKLVSHLAPELVAGRLISAAAGTLTIPVLYALAARVMGGWAGTAASLALAISPLHIWYSQEARPYALVGLLVALSYLALVAVYQNNRRPWIAVYGVSLVCALYVEESAFFALAPQAIVHSYMFWRRRRQANLAIGTTIGAAITFLPWIPHLLSVARPTSEQAQFALSPAKIASSLLSITGAAAGESVFSGAQVPAWYRWPTAHWAIVLSLGVTAGFGAIALAQRSWLAALITAACSAGTILAAAVISTVYPSYTERTVLSAILGWTLLIGATTVQAQRWRWVSIALRLNTAALLTLSLVTVQALYADAYKQDWRGLAQGTALVARFGWPIVTYPTVAGTLIGLYQPRVFEAQHIALGDGASLPAMPHARRNAALWLAYIAGTGEDRLQAQLAAQGYTRVLHAYYPYPLYLDLYAQPEATLGRPLSINGRFDEQGARVIGWQLPSEGTELLADGDHGNELVITAATAADYAARTAAPALADHLYTLDVEAQSQLSSGASRVFLICVSGRGAFLAVAPDGGGATVPDDDRWQDIRIGLLCPAGTSHVRVDLRQDGIGTTRFRDVTLRQMGDEKAPSWSIL